MAQDEAFGLLLVTIMLVLPQKSADNSQIMRHAKALKLYLTPVIVQISRFAECQTVLPILDKRIKFNQ